MVLSSDAIKYYDAMSKGKFKYAKLSQRLVSDLNGFAFPLNHYINDEFNRRTVQLLECGVIDGIIKIYNIIYHVHGWKNDDEGPQILTFDSLEFWFQLWFGCLLISLAGFCLEHFAKIYVSKFSLKKALRSVIRFKLFCGKCIRRRKLKIVKSITMRSRNVKTKFVKSKTVKSKTVCRKESSRNLPVAGISQGLKTFS